MKSKSVPAIIALILLIVAAHPAFSGPNASLGLGIPAAALYDSGGELVLDGVFPLPLAELELSYLLPLSTAPAGGLEAGAGLRAIGFMIGTSFGCYAWPDLRAQWRLGSLIAEGRLGGGLVTAYTDSGFSYQASPVFFPDLSIWWAPGSRRTFRIGGGLFGKLSLPGGESVMGGLADGILLYAGLKASFGRK